MNTELTIKIVMFVLVVFFFILRSRFTTHYKKFTPRTLIKYIIVIFIFYLYLGNYIDFALLPLNIYFRVIIGILLIVAGMFLLFWSHRHLGKNWSPIIEKKFSNSRRLIKTGPYKYIQHPIYTASIVALLGMGILSANWLFFCIPLAILLIFYLRKIPKEEKELIRNFGKSYKDYAEKTGRFFPKLYPKARL